MRYAAEMSNVAARQPGGRASIRLAVEVKVPHAVGKSSEQISEFIDGRRGSRRGYERSCIMRNLDECGLGTKPSGDVAKGPIMASRAAGEKGAEYLPADCSSAMY